MRKPPLLIFLFLVSCQLIWMHTANAQHNVKTKDALDARQEGIITISVFTAQGEMEKLHKALNVGLDAGLSINEIKEILVQLYAYVGFPRSLNALSNLMSVIKERKQKGIDDIMGRDASPLPGDKSLLQFGTETQTKLIGQPVKGELYEFAPVIDKFLKAHLFGDIFGRNNLDWRTRELATISALASLRGAENQLRSHFGVSMHNGLTEAELNQFVTIIKSNAGLKEGNVADDVLQKVLKRTPDSPPSNTGVDAGSSEKTTLLFPKGKKITNDNFTGSVWLEDLVVNDSLNDTRVGNVTFEPGARTKWHYHPDGQILLATGGTGFYQEKGSPKKILYKGNVVKCPPNVVHWHGASNNEEFVQVAISGSLKGATVWLQPVTDEEYNALK